MHNFTDCINQNEPVLRDEKFCNNTIKPNKQFVLKTDQELKQFKCSLIDFK